MANIKDFLYRNRQRRMKTNPPYQAGLEASGAVKDKILEVYGWWHEKPEHPAMVMRWERDAIGLYEDWQDAIREFI